MAHLHPERYVPDARNERRYDELYGEYLTLHDYFGRGVNDVMKRLRDRARQARAVHRHDGSVKS